MMVNLTSSVVLRHSLMAANCSLEAIIEAILQPVEHAATHLRQVAYDAFVVLRWSSSVW